MVGKAKVVIILFSALFVAYGLVGGMLDKVSARDDTYRDLSIFTHVLNKVEEDYVERPDLGKALQGALQGMMEALDPYSSFVDGKTYRELTQAKEGLSASPGIVLSKRYGYVYVVSVIAHSPAEREGLRTGDIIESIDGEVTTSMSLWEAEKRLVGEPGSSVSIRLIRARRTAPVRVEIVRQEIGFPEVSARIVEDGIGFLKIPHFKSGISEEVSSKIKMLQASGMRGLLIDVRGTALGKAEEAVRVGDLFVAKGKTLLVEESQKGPRTEIFSLTQPLVSDIPIVLLLDGGTSGAAEVFAAALDDHRVAKTVGEKTDGYGSQQEFFHLDDGSVLHVSTKLFYRPTGTAIQAEKLKDSGISPDVRRPNQDFMTNFYLENTPEGPESSPGEGFYRKLNEAISEDQFQEGLRQLRAQLSEEKAA